MTSREKQIEGFVYPTDAGFNESIGTICASYFRRLGDLLTRGLSAKERDYWMQRVSIICETSRDPEGFWNPELGRATEASAFGIKSQVERVVQLILSSISARPTLSFEVRFEEKTQFWLNGILLAPATELLVTFNSEKGEVVIDGGEPLVFVFASDGRFGVVNVKKSVTEIPGRTVASPVYRTNANKLIDGDSHAPLEMNKIVPRNSVGSANGGIRILESTLPNYVPWVLKLCRGVLPFYDPKSPAIHSGSTLLSPGLVLISEGSPDVFFAESFVHECSHQYFYLLEKATPLARKNSERRFYSPIVEKDRSAVKLLLTIHAITNILTFLARSLEREELSASWTAAKGSASHYLEMGKYYHKTLDEAEAEFTETGQIFWSFCKEKFGETATDLNAKLELVA